MILSKFSRLFWAGAFALSVCVPGMSAQDNTETERVPVEEVASVEEQTELDFNATLNAAENGDAHAQFLLSYYYVDDEQPDIEKSVAWLKSAAEGGHPLAQYVLGDRYFEGVGVEESLPKAVEWWKKAADQGEPNAQFRYGCCLVLGIKGIVDANPECGLDLISEAAIAGDESAQLWLGNAYRDGEFVEKNHELSLTWFRSAAECGNTDAQRALGEIYSFGVGVPADEEKAISWFRLAAEQGDAKSQGALAEIYWNRGDKGEAFFWAQEAAEQGDGGGFITLAFYYWESGPEQDVEKSIEFLKLAAEKDIAFACYFLGCIYREGIGVPADMEEAVHLWCRAFELGDRECAHNLGIAYESGTGIEKDEERAVYFYKIGAEHGDEKSQFALGRCYSDGIGLEKDPEKSLFWYRQAAENGHLAAQAQVGFICLRGNESLPENPEEGIKWLTRSAEGGWWVAQSGLVNLYLGILSERFEERDPEKAVYWMQRLAEMEPDDNDSEKIPTERAGVYRAMLGAYLRDQGKLEDAVRWFEKSAELGHPVGQYNLGILYHCGEGVPEDKEKSAELFRLAAEQGYASAQYNLFLCYINGDGVPKDTEKAMYWLRVAAEGLNYFRETGATREQIRYVECSNDCGTNGDGVAQYIYARELLRGKYVGKDEEKAIVFLKKSVAQGNPDASELLKKLEATSKN